MGDGEPLLTLFFAMCVTPRISDRVPFSSPADQTTAARPRRLDTHTPKEHQHALKGTLGRNTPENDGGTSQHAQGVSEQPLQKCMAYRHRPALCSMFLGACEIDWSCVLAWSLEGIALLNPWMKLGSLGRYLETSVSQVGSRKIQRGVSIALKSMQVPAEIINGGVQDSEGEI